MRPRRTMSSPLTSKMSAKSRRECRADPGAHLQNRWLPQDDPHRPGIVVISRDLDIGAYQKGVVLDFSRPGKQTDNSFIESFTASSEVKCLNAQWFLSLDDARRKMEDWRRDYNQVRPHSAIVNKAPISLLNGSSAPQPA